MNEELRKKLGMTATGTRAVRTADGTVHLAPVVKGVQIYYLDRDITCDAFVSDNCPECLLGVIPMEGMDVVVDPNAQAVIPNPAHPNGPEYLMMLNAAF
jgi:predicted aspartyl protease